MLPAMKEQLAAMEEQLTAINALLDRIISKLEAVVAAPYRPPLLTSPGQRFSLPNPSSHAPSLGSSSTAPPAVNSSPMTDLDLCDDLEISDHNPEDPAEKPDADLPPALDPGDHQEIFDPNLDNPVAVLDEAPPPTLNPGELPEISVTNPADFLGELDKAPPPVPAHSLMFPITREYFQICHAESSKLDFAGQLWGFFLLIYHSVPTEVKIRMFPDVDGFFMLPFEEKVFDGRQAQGGGFVLFHVDALHLTACSEAPSMSLVVMIHAQAIKTGCSSLVLVQKCLAYMYAFCGDIGSGKLTFNGIVECYDVSANMMLGGVMKCGCFDDALQLFDKMSERNVITWSVILNGLVQSSGFKEGLKFFRRMLEETVVRYHCEKLLSIDVSKIVTSLTKGIVCSPGPVQEEEFSYTLSWACNVDGTPFLVASGSSGIIHLINAGNEKIDKSIVGHGGSINEIRTQALKPSLAVSASKDEYVQLWNAHTGNCILIIAGAGGPHNEVLSVDSHPYDIYWIANCGLPSKFLTKYLLFPKLVVFVHSNYVDCNRWLGDFILSKSVGNKTILWEPKPKDQSSRESTTVAMQKHSLSECDQWFIQLFSDFHYKTAAIENEEEQQLVLERIEAVYWEQILGLKRSMTSFHHMGQEGVKFDLITLIGIFFGFNQVFSVTWHGIIATIAAYANCGELYLDPMFTTTTNHVLLFHGSEIGNQGKSAISFVRLDVHAKLMGDYKQVPQWWFLILLAGGIIFSLMLPIIQIEEVQLTWCGMLFAVGLVRLVTPSIEVIQATTSQQHGYDIIAHPCLVMSLRTRTVCTEKAELVIFETAGTIIELSCVNNWQLTPSITVIQLLIYLILVRDIHAAKESGLLLSFSTWVSVILVCTQVRGFSSGKSLHDFAIKCEGLDNAVMISTLDSMYDCLNDLYSARRLLFEVMLATQLVARNAMLFAYAKVCEASEAGGVFPLKSSTNPQPVLEDKDNLKGKEMLQAKA